MSSLHHEGNRLLGHNNVGLPPPPHDDPYCGSVVFECQRGAGTESRPYTPRCQVCARFSPEGEGRPRRGLDVSGCPPCARPHPFGKLRADLILSQRERRVPVTRSLKAEARSL